MQAIVQDAYGPPDRVLHLREIPRPTTADDEVLVRVHATSVHPDVWHVVTGRPYILRLMGAGMRRPKNPVPGTDVAGIVESVGKDVTRFEPGDEVFGETFLEMMWRNGGAFAEYVSVPQDALALKPAGISFEQAAGVPTPGFIALLNLASGARIQAGHRVLVNGAGGSVGSTALQLAKARGATVTGVDSGEKEGLVRALGADHFIDYTREDFTRADFTGPSERYDLIFDVASNLTLSACKGALTPTGIYIVIGHDHFGAAGGRVLGSLPRMLGLLAIRSFVGHLPKQSPPTPSKREVMDALKGLLEMGKLTPIVDRTYPLSEVPEAMAYMQSGVAQGRIIITPQT